MHQSGLLARIIRLVQILLVVLVLPTLAGIVLDTRLGLWPWGLVAALAFGIPLATFFIVRSTLDAYRRIEDAHASASSSRYPTSSIKEDERA